MSACHGYHVRIGGRNYADQEQVTRSTVTVAPPVQKGGPYPLPLTTNRYVFRKRFQHKNDDK